MNIKQVVYKNTDTEYNKVIDFLNEVYLIDKSNYWSADRMNFWRYAVHGKKEQNDTFFKDNVMLWCENEKIIALFISEYGRNDAFIETHPDHKSLYNEILNWTLTDWANEKEEILIDVVSSNNERIEILKENGYSFKEHTENERYYDLNTVDLNYKLEEGFKIESFLDNKNYDSRVDLVKSAFDNTNYSKENLLSIHNSPDYQRDLDLCISSNDDKLVAYCIGWHHKTSKKTGYVEPIGTHADYRKRGFASAITKECFKRLKAQGKEIVEISSYAEPDPSNYLYDSLKPIKKIEIHQYKKNMK